MTDDQVRTAVVQVYGPQIVATPLARETWWAYALPFACLLVGGALVLWLGRGWIARHREAAEEGKAIDTKNPQPDTIEQERIEAAMRELE